jgi:hypothetical protein
MGVLIHKIETENHDVIDQIEMFSLQIANEKVEFSAAGFFPINYTLIFSVRKSFYVFSFLEMYFHSFQIFGGVTTYIIILIQLSSTLSH